MRPNAVCGLTSVWWLKMHTIHLRERSSDEYCIASVASTARVGVASRCHLVGNPISSVFVKLSRFAVHNPNAWALRSIHVLHLPTSSHRPGGRVVRSSLHHLPVESVRGRFPSPTFGFLFLDRLCDAMSHWCVKL